GLILDPDAVCPGFYRLVHHGRPHRIVSGCTRSRCSRTRYLFRHRALPLRDGGGRSLRISRRNSLLVAEDYRQTLSRVVGTPRGDNRVHWFQPDVLPAVRSRLSRHAATLLGLFPYAGMAGAERAFDRRSQHSGNWLSPADGLFILVTALWQTRGRQSMDGHRPGMENAVSTPHFQFRRDS